MMIVLRQEECTLRDDIKNVLEVLLHLDECVCMCERDRVKTLEVNSLR